ncbi:phytanoyl-CoA dioxygenase family protein [Pseudomonas sp. BN414]|uniref:phytanoyl-CoA dioxygenase family protein n=1 Tax=Pseudomonadaceae TaxID=135621 RepID=UPI000416C6EE|nr:MULTISPECIES: phytanoyl-CoA dioxygenase family protein [Pseudomonas]MDH4568986.1 phytanoyl-CoA dioxygenase family protein [Pseudomonas sp. BN414]MDH4656791.1 phytanoyl-CoA dioxygenase family protein [Pseudomonas sp. BN606]NWL76553.1 phytanoyl-CoA dioxygenase [Pseudomonas taiwanensis]WVK91007.1 phytanoyl-CoA dioxygenase family protein [Pseudomonas sp. JS3066]
MLIDQSIREAFRNDGAVLIENCLDQTELAQCYEAFKWNVANPGPYKFQALDGTKLQTHIDNANPAVKDKYDDLVMSLPFGKLFQELWGSEHVWYFAEEVFAKEGGKSGRGPWHQDTANLPWAGEHWGNAWITFHKIPKKNSLEIVRGSHRGIQYDGASFANAEDPTDPLYGDGSLPRLPHIDKDLAEDPNAWDVLSWPITPGDVVLLHPHSLHGGAAVDADCPDRHTLVLRFFGDDARFRCLPTSNPKYARNGVLFSEEMAKLNEGEPFRSPIFRQII